MASAGDISEIMHEILHEILIVSEVRFLRDSLAEVLARLPSVRICGQASGLGEACIAAKLLNPTILLLDVGLPGGLETAAQFSATHPAIRVIALRHCGDRGACAGLDRRRHHWLCPEHRFHG